MRKFSMAALASRTSGYWPLSSTRPIVEGCMSVRELGILGYSKLGLIGACSLGGGHFM
jgi:hypothetical protein